MKPDYLSPNALAPIALRAIPVEQIKRSTRERPELVAHVLSILQRDLAIVTELARRAPSVLNAPVHPAIRQALIDLAASVVKQGARTRGVRFTLARKRFEKWRAASFGVSGSKVPAGEQCGKLAE